MTKAIQNLREVTPLRDQRYGMVFELAGAATDLNNLGFAWVEVDVGATSPLHFHKLTTELYHIVEGSGLMVLNQDQYTVGPGDCISIAPGIKHAIKNTGGTPLRFFCATSPKYNEEDDYEI